MESFLDILPALIKEVPSIAVLIVIIMLFLQGKIVPKQTVADLLAAKDTQLERTVQLYDALLKQKETTLEVVNARLAERDHLASLGLQYMVSSQKSQDAAADLLTNLETLLDKKDEDVEK
jgi:HJR/Mrr/RecB family endonuclease